VPGCATKKPIVPPEKLWSEGEEAFHDEAYELAVQRYKALLDQHPFDPRAEEAELKIAQSHYLAQRYAEAIAAFGDFERMHPTSPSCRRSSITSACRTSHRRARAIVISRATRMPSPISAT